MSGDESIDLGARVTRVVHPKRDPILIPCEGSGCPPTIIGTCAMCGRVVMAEDGIVAEHQRDDIIARINRGDFG